MAKGAEVAVGVKAVVTRYGRISGSEVLEVLSEQPATVARTSFICGVG